MNYGTFQDGNDFHSNQKMAHSLKPPLLKSLKGGGRHAFPLKFRPMFNRYLGGCKEGKLHPKKDTPNHLTLQVLMMSNPGGLQVTDEGDCLFQLFNLIHVLNFTSLPGCI